jgi:hypothetical protein
MEFPPAQASLTRILRVTTAAYVNELPEKTLEDISLRVRLSSDLDALLALYQAGGIDPQQALREFVQQSTTPQPDHFDGLQTETP